MQFVFLFLGGGGLLLLVWCLLPGDLTDILEVGGVESLYLLLVLVVLLEVTGLLETSGLPPQFIVLVSDVQNVD